MNRDGAPPPPPEVSRWMERFGGSRSGGAGLREAGLRALREALARPGRNREGAFALLAADALLTEAVEEAAEAPDPDAELRTLVAAVGGEAPEEVG